MRTSFVAALVAASTIAFAATPAPAPAPLSPNWYVGGNQAGAFLSGVEPAPDGHDAHYLLSKTSDAKAWASLSQGIPAQPYLGQRVRFRARLRTRDLGNWGGLWMRIDGEGKQLGFYNSQDKPIKGTTDWQERSVVLDVPPDAKQIIFGVIGTGTGQIWMEPLDIGAVGREVPVDVSARAPAFPTVSGAIPRALAREVVGKTVELVESKGVYPRQQAEYAQARAELLALVEGDGGQVDRAALQMRIQGLLATLDADGHAHLLPPMPAASPRSQGALAAPDAPRPPSFDLVRTGRGTVLHWTPPAWVGAGDAGFPDYLKRFYDEAAVHPEFAQACALVVDLSAQTGGNAWPPFIAMYPLFGDANTARRVDRDGKRESFVDRAGLEQMNGKYAPGQDAPGHANPFAPYASGPLAVVVGDQTSSAGEMLLVALLGESRVQTFGRTSQGMSTSNTTYVLADGSTLALTTKRYALGDGPVFHGGIAPMHPAPAGEALDASVRTAADWAAANSPRCQAGS